MHVPDLWREGDSHMKNEAGGQEGGQAGADLADLPRVEAPASADVAAARVIHVLLVEDEALIAEIIGEALMDAGHAVHWAGNAADALSHLTGGARVDVLFTDINLPGEMDGAMLAEFARKADPRLPVIYASGRWGLLDKLRGQPDARILPKPYTPARACELVELLGLPRLAAEDEAAGALASAL